MSRVPSSASRRRQSAASSSAGLGRDARACRRNAGAPRTSRPNQAEAVRPAHGHDQLRGIGPAGNKKAAQCGAALARERLIGGSEAGMNRGGVLDGILAVTAHLGAEACGPTPAFAGTAGNVKADLEGIASKKPARSRSPRRTFEIRQKLRPVGITWPGECSRRRRSNRLPGPTGNRSLLVSCCRVPHRSSFFQGIA